MVEVLFGESEAASMKAAKNTVVVGGANGPASDLAAGKKKTPEKLFAGCLWSTLKIVLRRTGDGI